MWWHFQGDTPETILGPQAVSPDKPKASASKPKVGTVPSRMCSDKTGAVLEAALHDVKNADPATLECALKSVFQFELTDYPEKVEAALSDAIQHPQESIRAAALAYVPYARGKLSISP